MAQRFGHFTCKLQCKNTTLLLERIDNSPFEHITKIIRSALKELFLNKPLNLNEIDWNPKLKQKQK